MNTKLNEKQAINKSIYLFISNEILYKSGH